MGRSDTVLSWEMRGAALPSRSAEKDFWSRKIEGLRAVYLDYHERVPVSRQVIFYECMSGDRVGDNPFAIFEQLMTNPKYSSYLHVWSLNDPAGAPAKYADLPNVVFVPRGTKAYAYFLARAGYIICNAYLPSFFIRRDGQKYLNTWHGIAYKAIGRDTPKARFGAPASTAAFQKATHVVSPCQFMTEAMLSGYSMRGVSGAVIAETGYPRVDLTVNLDPQREREIRELLAIKPRGENGWKPVVLYAPTWRAEGGADVVDTQKLMDDLGALAGLDSIHILYRGHHRMDRLIRDQFVGGEIGAITIPSHDISTNELLAVVDVLITDYSSVFFDFLPTGRPVIQYLYDLDEYERTRGLNLALDELPGAVAQTQDELVAAVAECSAALRSATVELSTAPLQGDRYAAAQQRFCSHDDGGASQRAVEFFFENKRGEVPVRSCRDGRPTKVFWADASDDKSETAAFWPLVIESGQSAGIQTTLVTHRTVAISRELLATIRTLRTNIATISFETEAPAVLPSEQSAYSRFVAMPDLRPEDVARELQADPALHRLFQREYRRRLDDSQFDEVVLAPWLSNHEMALAYFADRSHSLVPSVDPAATTGGSLPHRLVTALLPYGTRRRDEVARVVWSLRRRFGRS